MSNVSNPSIGNSRKGQRFLDVTGTTCVLLSSGMSNVMCNPSIGNRSKGQRFLECRDRDHLRSIVERHVQCHVNFSIGNSRVKQSKGQRFLECRDRDHLRSIVEWHVQCHVQSQYWKQQSKGQRFAWSVVTGTTCVLQSSGMYNVKL
ncbi:hypothetical protein J6590_080465 [Homalodisca vitripennis]|nr:hypothetical protein J6590_080465 [Homalodisca vitripennis]